MKFRTELTVSRSPFTVSHSRHGFMAGSCFADNIYRKLSAAKFPVTANPTGILFNPASIAAMIGRVAEGRPYTEAELVHGDDGWFSYDHHGAFSGDDMAAVLDGMNRSLAEGHRALFDADYVVVTFGTAWVYRLVSDGRVVANCHKMPSAEFVRERLSVGEIVDVFGELLKGELAGRQVLFTVSPVRHLKDGLAENSLSKAVLRVAAGELAARYDNAFYFPAFEIVNDDLRDYRFYAPDMAHPSPQAVDYVWEKFVEFAMDTETASLLPRLERLDAAMHHRVMNPSANGCRAFREASLRLLDGLRRDLPAIDFSAEETYLAGLADVEER